MDVTHLRHARWCLIAFKFVVVHCLQIRISRSDIGPTQFNHPTHTIKSLITACMAGDSPVSVKCSTALSCSRIYSLHGHSPVSVKCSTALSCSGIYSSFACMAFTLFNPDCYSYYYMREPSLVPRPSTPPILDRLQVVKYWRCRRPGNEAKEPPKCAIYISAFPAGVLQCSWCTALQLVSCIAAGELHCSW